jgi:hypothetical protein
MRRIARPVRANLTAILLIIVTVPVAIPVWRGLRVERTERRVARERLLQLRKRIQIDPGEPRIIRTVHGVGYRYDGVDSNPDG